MISKNIKKEKGFTLVELMIATALFLSVCFICMGAILSVFSANKRVQNMKSVIDNMNFAMEDMARTLRFGNNIHCGSSGQLSSTQDCLNGEELIAVSFNGQTIVYKLENSALKKSFNGGSTFSNISPAEVTIQYLKFYTVGSQITDNIQPYVRVVMKGYVGSAPTPQSIFSLQATLSQRSIDI